jgi:hypothetical protein
MEKLTILTERNKGSKESKEPDFVKDKERSEEKQGELSEEKKTTNQVF